MDKIIQFDLEKGGNLLVEVDEASGIVATGSALTKTTQTLDKAISQIKPGLESVIGQLCQLSIKPDELEVEFGIKLSAEAGAIIAKAGTEANFRAKLTLRFDRSSEGQDPDDVGNSGGAG